MTFNTNIEEKISSLINDLNEKKYNQVIQNSKELLKYSYNLPILHILIGVSYFFKNENIKAIESYEVAIKLQPENEETYRNLGKSLIKVNKLTEAKEVFEKSIDLKSNNPDAYFNLGLISLENDNLLESIKYFEKSIEYNNRFYQAYYNLGIVFDLIGNNKESAKNYKRTLEININHIKALNNLATLYINSNKNDEALELLKRCIQIDPSYAQALTNLGVVLQDKNNFSESLLFYEKAIKTNPSFVKAIVQKLFIKRKICDWSNQSEDFKQLTLINESIEEATPWQLLPLDDNPHNEYIRAKKYAKQFNILREKINIVNKDNKIKIGYFTSDFHYHAGMMNMEGLFKYYDKSKFEIIGFDYGFKNNDETHQRIKKYFDKFFYVHDLTDNEIASLAIENNIDIAIHRNGYSQNSRTKIFSYNPAILQINYLGYPGTTGLEFIDYIIADKIVIPKENYNFFSEKIIFMPNSYYPTFNERVILKKDFNRSEIGIPENAFVLCCFNNSYKISEEEFSIWMQIMNKYKNTYLILLIRENITRENLLTALRKYNIDEKRLIFFDYININEHLGRHHIADLYLDTFNVNGHTSAVDSLFTGLPVITKIGKSFSARVCASLLNAFGMPELVTHNNKEYFELISKLILDKDFYNNILNRTKKNIKTSTLFDTKKYVKDFEKCLLKALKYKLENSVVKNVEL